MSDQYVGRDSQANDGRALIYLGVAIIVVGLGVQMAVGLASGNSADSPKTSMSAESAEADSSDAWASKDTSEPESTPAFAKEISADAEISEAQGPESADAPDTEGQKAFTPVEPATIQPDRKGKTFFQCIALLLPRADGTPNPQATCTFAGKNQKELETNAKKLCVAGSENSCDFKTCKNLVKSCSGLPDAPAWFKQYITKAALKDPWFKDFPKQ